MKNFINTVLIILVMACCFPGGLFANESNLELQQGNTKTITGTVTDENGDPATGVSISVLGTSRGVISDLDGKYSIQVSNPEKDVLKVSFLGYKEQQIAVGNKSVIDIKLAEDTQLLDEVVVVGFGTQKKINLTGAVGMTDSKTFEARPVTTVAQALQGVVPGLNIYTTGGGYENAPSINIRGMGTIGDGSSGNPLILIDGVEGDLTALNPQDIESISVLKDASASAVYGSRAPFGVILVVTKSGQTGKMKINYNNSFRDSKPITFPKMMDSYTYALYMNDAHQNSGMVNYFQDEHLQRILDYQSGKLETTIFEDPANKGYWANFFLYGNANVDWYKEMFKSSMFSQEHSLSFNGGTEKLTYYFSANYLGQDGLLRIGEEDFSRYTATGKVSAQVTNWLKFQYSTRYIRENFGRPTLMNSGFYTDLARMGWPTISPKDPNGNYFNVPALDMAEGGDYDLETDYLYQQFIATFEPIKDWKIQGEFNFKTRNQFAQYDRQVTYNYDVAGNPYVLNNDSYVYSFANKDNYYGFNVYSDYTKSIKKHNFKVMAGFQSEEMKYRSMDVQRKGIILPSQPVLDLTSGNDINGNPVTPYITGGFKDWSAAGIFGRLNYDFDGKYLLEASFRYDGSSRFRKGHRWNFSPSFSAGWNIAKESFFSSFEEYINTLKLRVSYGSLGNQNTTNWYPTYINLPVTTGGGTWIVNGLRPNIAGAPGLVSNSLTWEKIRTWNVGLDVSAFSNRLTASADVYKRKTLDMVGPAPEMPDILGTGVPKMNNTDLETYGFEVQVRWNDRLKNGLGYSIGLTLSDAQTKITSYPNETNNIWTYRTGAKVGDIWGYETKGIAKTQEEMDAHLASLPNGGQNALGSKWEMGDIMYADLNGDGKIDGGAGTIDDHGDVKIIGNNTPRYAFGIDLGMDWKGFDFRAFFQGIMKKDVFQGSYYFWGTSNNKWWSTGFVEHKDYFRSDPEHPFGQNLNAYYPRPEYSNKNKSTQTRFLQNAAYIRLKNLQIGYTLPAHITQKVHIDKLRFFVSGENLWTGTSLTSIFDPELVDQGGYNWGNQYPLSRTFSFGLSLNF